MLLRIVAIIFPVFAIVAVGFFYARRKRPDMAFANQLNMDVFVPALVFAALAGKSFDLTAYWPLAAGGVIVVLGSGLLTWPLAKLLKVDSRTFLPPMMFNNSGNMGLPLMLLAFGEQALPAAVVLARHLDARPSRKAVESLARAGDCRRLGRPRRESAEDRTVVAALYRDQDARRRVDSLAAFFARRAPNQLGN
jgi:hypothetical protein